MDLFSYRWNSRNRMGDRPEIYRKFFAALAERADGGRDDCQFCAAGPSAQDHPVGTGYAVWTGIGAAGTALIGMAPLGESREPLRLLCLVLIVAGVVGLKFASALGH
jgi:hypothetical protein